MKIYIWIKFILFNYIYKRFSFLENQNNHVDETVKIKKQDTVFSLKKINLIFRTTNSLVTT